MVSIHKLIAAISPDVYCSTKLLREGESSDPSDKTVRDMVKRMIKEETKKIEKRVEKKKENKEKIEARDTESDMYLRIAEKAEPIESDYVDINELRFTKAPFAKSGLKAPIEKHMLVYDAFSQNLEPIYFWIFDTLQADYGTVEKVVDTFTSSPGSGHFAEMQARATRLQDEAMKIFGTTNTVIRSILNLVYDLKEFKLVLKTYDDYHVEDKGKKQAALLGLKQRWLDNVDIKRGTTSIKGMAQQFDFVTLIDAFMVADEESVRKGANEKGGLDLNERVRRILQQRIPEFYKWVDESEQELRKRYEIEKTYLRSQVNSLQLYARWLQPYLRGAQALEQKPSDDAGLVSAFNSSLFQLTLIGKGKYDPEGDIAAGELPEFFRRLKLRKYTPIVVVEFMFRSVPDSIQGRQGAYSFRGKVEVTFTSYALHDDELKILKDQLTKDDINLAYKYILGATDDSLAQIKGDIYEFLGEGAVKDADEKKSNSDENPFSAFVSLFRGSKKKEEKVELWKGIPKDNDNETILRSQAVLEARNKCRRLYDSYKKAHSMPTFPPSKM